MLISAGKIAGEPSPEKKKSPNDLSSSLLLLLLPDELILNCMARIPRSHYPSISLVSKTFKRLITSREIYIQRSIFNHTERVLYVALRSHATETPRWYALNKKTLRNESDESMIIHNKLVPIPLFPPVPCWGMSVVSVDSKIYVLGGVCVDSNDVLVSTVFVIECPSHRYRFLPSMKQARGCAATGVIDGKLYVIGGCDPLSLNFVEAFDLEKETWETVSTDLSNVEVHDMMIQSFVMNDKIYFMDKKRSFVYDPREGGLESDSVLNRQWKVDSCVVDNKLYCFGCSNKMCVFDPVTRVWSRVKGLEDLPRGSRMANLGRGKLAVVYDVPKWGRTEILCTEVGLETQESGEVWGTVLSSNVVISLDDSSNVLRALAVSF